MTQKNNRRFKKKRFPIQVKSRLGRACLEGLLAFLTLEAVIIAVFIILVPALEYFFKGKVEAVNTKMIFRGSLFSLGVGFSAMIMSFIGELIDEWNDRRKQKKRIKDNQWNSDL